MSFYDHRSYLHELFPVLSRSLHLGKEKKHIYIVNCFAPLFAHIIAGSYKKGTAHHCELEMYLCDLCNRRFSTQGSLKRHRESVNRQSGGFSCRVCGKRFYRKDHLGRHLKTHRAACPMDKTFVDLPPPPPPPSPPKSRGERPLCDVCAKTFASQKTLKRHRQTVHQQNFEKT